MPQWALQLHISPLAFWSTQRHVSRDAPWSFGALTPGSLRSVIDSYVRSAKLQALSASLLLRRNAAEDCCRRTAPMLHVFEHDCKA
eukprot:13784988-Alexandrium_andersonii.AAC.1